MSRDITQALRVLGVLLAAIYLTGLLDRLAP